MAKTNYYCPVEVTIDVIGGKWKCTILWWLRRGSKRFGELRQLIPEVSQQVLTQQLRELEADGLILREAFREAPPRVEYSLTEYGKTVRPITELMCEWGKTHLPDHPYSFQKLQDFRVLVIADDAALRDRLQQDLTAAGAQVTAVDAAIALTASPPNPEIVIVDLELVTIDAVALVQQIRARRSEPEALVAIALTTNEADTLPPQFQLHLVKPIEIAELEAAIASFMGQLE